uniref:tRNA/rRNA methyltransferase SpoU type domain-containing protein n=1 Tax=Cucumis sativus TaxID=3659 RepID=A0A0A0L5K1_CUCSA
MQCSCLSWSSNPKLAPSFPKSKLSSINIAEAIDFTGRIPLPSHVKAITSISNPFVKHCVKLRFSSSYRHFHGSVVVVGATPIREICKFQESLHGVTCTLECLLLLDEVEVPEGLVNLTVRIVRVSSAVMKKLSGLQSTESIDAIALMRIPPSFCSVDGNEKEVDFKRWFPSPHRILVLEGIQDPGNLGTLIRSALAFKWNTTTRCFITLLWEEMKAIMNQMDDWMNLERWKTSSESTDNGKKAQLFHFVQEEQCSLGEGLDTCKMKGRKGGIHDEKLEEQWMKKANLNRMDHTF